MVEVRGVTSNRNHADRVGVAAIRKEIMVDLRGHFSNPEALLEALEEMEEVLTGLADSGNDGPINQAMEPDPA